MQYNATAELDRRLTPSLAETLLDELADYHPAVGRSALGRAEVTITLPAETLRQAISTALALLASRPVTALAVMPTDDYDRQLALMPVPELVSVAEAAELLGITRQAVLGRIDAGSLPSVRVGNIHAIPRSAVA